MIRNIAIVSLSSGIIGEPGVHFEIEIGLQRLKEYGLNVKFMPHALKGLEYVKAHPEKRARDLLEAFRDPEVDMNLCAIGGDDTYRLLQGPSVFSGRILGGCIDTIYDCFNGDRYADMPALCEEYHLFPDASDWVGRILLLESSEEKPTPEKYRRALLYLKEADVFEAVSGVLVGKPMDDTYAEEYKRLLIEVIDRPELPVLFNINVGHALPRCIIPFGVNAVVDAEKQSIRFGET